MDIVIRTASDEPLYSQIYRQLRDQIIAGTLAPGDALPSIRSLARDLRISVITTKRAYDELERDGFIVTAAARGCFVAQKDMTRIREDRLMQVEQLALQRRRLLARLEDAGRQYAESFSLPLPVLQALQRPLVDPRVYEMIAAAHWSGAKGEQRLEKEQ